MTQPDGPMAPAGRPADDGAPVADVVGAPTGDDGLVPAADGDEIAAFWQLARGRAGLGRLAVLVGTGSKATVPPPAWAFGDSPRLADDLLDLVLRGVKTATTSAQWEYTDAGQPLPDRGDLSIVLDGRGHPRALIRTTAVRTVRFADVDAEHAYLEGEDDRSLAAWTTEHAAYFGRVAAAAGRTFDGDTEVVLERFEVRFPARARSRSPQGSRR